MATYQLDTLIAKVQRRVRDTGYSTVEITDYLNDTQRDITNEYRLPFMERTVAYTLTIGNRDITAGTGLPATFSEAINLTLTTAGSEKQIPYKDFRDLDVENPDSTDQTAYPNGSPQYWTIYNSMIQVFPAPSTADTVSLRYYAAPTELVNSTDVPIIPEAHQEVLIAGAAYRVLQVKDNYDQAGIWQNKYDELLAKLVMRQSVKQAGRPTQMRINRRHLSKTSF